MKLTFNKAYAMIYIATMKLFKNKKPTAEQSPEGLTPEQARGLEYSLDRIFKSGEPCQLELITSKGKIILDYTGVTQDKVVTVIESDDKLIPNGTVIVVDGAPEGQTSVHGNIVPELPLEFRAQVSEGGELYFDPPARFTGYVDAAKITRLTDDGLVSERLFAPDEINLQKV